MVSLRMTCVVLAGVLLVGCATRQPSPRLQPVERPRISGAELESWYYPNNLKGGGYVNADGTIVWHASTTDSLEQVLSFYRERAKAMGLNATGERSMSVDSTGAGRPRAVFEHDALSFGHHPDDPVIAENVFGVRTPMYFVTAFVCQVPRDKNTRITMIYDAVRD